MLTALFNDGNTLYDVVFEGQAINLDVEDAFQNFAEELQLGTYDENLCNCTNQDMSSVIGIISQFADAPERKAGVLITEGLTVAVLCFGGGPVAIVDSHQHGGNGALVAWLQAAQIWFIGTKRVSKNTTSALWEICAH